MADQQPPIAPFRYATAPSGYVCSKCGATDCKLWRPYQERQARLFCGPCALADQEKPGPLDDNGCRRSELDGQWGDQIGWLVPAVPTEQGTSFWGYTSVPRRGVLWWRGLPTYPAGHPSPLPDPNGPCPAVSETEQYRLHDWESQRSALTCKACSARMVRG